MEFNGKEVIKVMSDSYYCNGCVVYEEKNSSSHLCNYCGINHIFKYQEDVATDIPSTDDAKNDKDTTITLASLNDKLDYQAKILIKIATLLRNRL